MNGFNEANSRNERSSLQRALGTVIALWGVLGVVVMLVQALMRLTPMASAALSSLHSPWQWALAIGWIAFNSYAEGYRGFHRGFSPRVIARALHLQRRPSLLRGVLAPLYCMSLFGASRRGLIVARVLLLGICALVAVVRMLDQPWRGIVDAGVVAGLALGVLSIGFHAWCVVCGKSAPVDPDLPATEHAAETQRSAQGG